MSLVREILAAFRHVRDGGQPARQPGGRGRWPQCPACFRRVPALCQDAEEGAEPCGLGLVCCCGGPHLAPKPARGAEGGGKFTFSVEKT